MDELVLELEECQARLVEFAEQKRTDGTELIETYDRIICAYIQIRDIMAKELNLQRIVDGVFDA